RQVLRISSFVMVPSMIGMAALAEPLIIATIGPKWTSAVPFLELLCIAGVAFHLNSINLNMLLVLCRSDLGLSLEIYKKIGIVLAIAIGVQFGIIGLVIGEVISAYVALLINTAYSKRLLNYSLIEQLGDVKATAIIAVIMGGAVYGVDHLIDAPAFLRVGIGMVVGAGVYFGLHIVSRSSEMELLQNIVVPKLRKIFRKSPELS